MKVYEKTLSNGNVFQIHTEGYPENPREWDNLGTMVCWHGGYNLGDEQPRCSPSEYKIPKGSVQLPLYLYDHSGITISTSPFSCLWDSGQVGFIFASPAIIRQGYGCKRISNKLRKKVEDSLHAEVEIYDAYLTGDVYYYVILDSKGFEVEACGGFYGSHKESGILDCLSEEARKEVEADL